MEYIVTGCIRNKLRGIRFNRCNVIYKDLTYTGKKYCKDLLVFGTPMKIEYDYWKGLSGSPVLNQDGEIVGMLNRVVDNSNKIYVLPIDTIIKFIDITIMNEENKK